MLRSIDCPDFDCAIYDTCGKIENIRCQCLAEFVYCGFECPCNVTKTYYRLAVFDQINCESGMLPCSEEVAKLWQNKGFKSMDHVELGCEFNDQYDSFRVVSAKVLPVK